MTRTWQIQEAESKLGELVNLANTEGPQSITRDGIEAAFLVSPQDFHRTSAREESLLEFFQKSPLRDLNLERTDEPSREVDFEVSS